MSWSIIHNSTTVGTQWYESLALVPWSIVTPFRIIRHDYTVVHDLARVVSMSTSLVR